MPPAPDCFADPQYDVQAVLAAGEDRWVARAFDATLGRDIVLKCAPLTEVVRELRTLMQLSPGLGPIAYNAQAFTDDCGILAMECLRGERLDRAQAALTDPAELNAHVLRAAPAICHAVQRLHLLDLLHGDLKPANLWLGEGWEESGHIQLIDFGGARGTHWADDDENLHVTPAFAAPERTRGWFSDARADQYALGQTLRVTYPSLEASPTIERMCSRRASQRFDSVRAARLSLQEELRSDWQPPAPTFPAGPWRDDTGLLDRVAESLQPEHLAHALLHGVPGADVRRAALEAWIAQVVDGARNIRTLIATTGEGEARAFAEMLDELNTHPQSGAPARFVVGVPDGSPRFWWTPEPAQSALQRFAAQKDVAQHYVRLPGLSPLTDYVGHALGSFGPAEYDLAYEMWQRSDGDLDAAERAFNCVAARGPIPSGDSVEPRRAGLGRALSSTRGTRWPLPIFEAAVPASPETPEPVEQLVHAGSRLARLGRSFPAEAASGFEREFGSSGLAAELLDAGLLVPSGRSGNLYEFTYEQLRQALLKRVPKDAPAIDQWAIRNVHKTYEDPLDVLEFAERATARGEPEAGAELATGVVKQAVTDFQWTWLLALTQATRIPRRPGPLSIDAIAQLANALNDLCGGAFLVDRTRIWMASATYLSSQDASIQVMYGVATTSSPTIAAEATERLMYLVAARGPRGPVTFDVLHSRLDELEVAGARLAPGIRQLRLGQEALRRHASATGRLLSEAWAALQGSELEGHRVEAGIGLAHHWFEKDASRSISLLESLLDSDSSHFRIVVLYNIARMYRLLGQDEKALEVAWRALRVEGRARLESVPAASVMALIANLLHLRSKTAEALEVLERLTLHPATQLSPYQYVQTHRMRAEVLVAAGDFAGASREVERCLGRCNGLPAAVRASVLRCAAELVTASRAWNDPLIERMVQRAHGVDCFTAGITRSLERASAGDHEAALGELDQIDLTHASSWRLSQWCYQRAILVQSVRGPGYRRRSEEGLRRALENQPREQCAMRALLWLEIAKLHEGGGDAALVVQAVRQAASLARRGGATKTLARALLLRNDAGRSMV